MTPRQRKNPASYPGHSAADLSTPSSPHHQYTEKNRHSADCLYDPDANAHYENNPNITAKLERCKHTAIHTCNAHRDPIGSLQQINAAHRDPFKIKTKMQYTTTTMLYHHTPHLSERHSHHLSNTATLPLLRNNCINTIHHPVSFHSQRLNATSRHDEAISMFFFFPQSNSASNARTSTSAYEPKHPHTEAKQLQKHRTHRLPKHQTSLSTLLNNHTTIRLKSWLTRKYY
ncbi:hypothetical protein XFHB_13940 [Xylella fastidiosa]|uniref:Uncharacterized protein n=1 Tax=Xylella fastidiosa TaxID=2371 RepID=A0ABD7BXL0_XYLFS|nr:hypothetical protein [Xylella fastidiosa]QPB72609.1 hypothetical protein XFHB_13940 [Xylella fastidiosa]